MRRTILLATVVDPVRGRDVVTLQACTMPDFENRLIVRADRANRAGRA
jgi:sortase (surface protein transpeptidase)